MRNGMSESKKNQMQTMQSKGGPLEQARKGSFSETSSVRTSEPARIRHASVDKSSKIHPQSGSAIREAGSTACAMDPCIGASAVER